MLTRYLSFLLLFLLLEFQVSLHQENFLEHLFHSRRAGIKFSELSSLKCSSYFPRTFLELTEFCVDIFFFFFFLLSFSSLNMFDHLHAIMVSGEKSVIHNFCLYVMCCLYYLRLSSVLTSSSLSLCLFLSLLSFCSFSPSSYVPTLSLLPFAFD